MSKYITILCVCLFVCVCVWVCVCVCVYVCVLVYHMYPKGKWTKESNARKT